MLEQLKLIANTLRAQELEAILHNMTNQEKSDFVNSVRSLDVVADKICTQH